MIKFLDRLRLKAKPLAAVAEPDKSPGKPRSELRSTDERNPAFESVEPLVATLRSQSAALTELCRDIDRSFAENDLEETQLLLTRFPRIGTRLASAWCASTIDVIRQEPESPNAKGLARLFGRFHSDSGDSRISLDWRGGDLQIHVRTRSELGRWRAYEKEPWTVEWIERVMAGGGVFYDVGANVGAYALIAASVAGERGRVVAFEPAYSTYAALIDNVILNRLEGRITALPFGLSDQLGLVELHYRSNQAGAAMHHLGSEVSESNKEVATTLRYPVLTYPLDRAITDFALPAPNHVKIDVDGHERSLLEGARETLAGTSLRSVLIECSGDALRTDVRRVLADEIGLTAAGEWTNAPEAGADRVSYLLFERR